MKQKAIFSAMAALFCLSAQAQTIYLETSFSDGMPEGFATYDLDQRTPDKDMQKLGFEVGSGWIVADEGHDGNRAAMATSFYKNSGAANDWLVTPALNVTSAKAVLRWRSRAQAQDFRDGLKVYIGTAGNTPGDFDPATPAFSVVKETYEWSQHELSLAQYVGQTVYVAFVNDSRDMQCIIVDDLFAGVPSMVGFSLDFGRCYNGEGDITVSGTAFATTDEPAAGFTIGFTTASQTIAETFDTTLLRDAPQPFTLSTPLHLGRFESADYTAWIKSGNDSVAISSRLTAVPRKIVVEEMTGTWCQFCVRGIGAMNYLAENYPQSFIGIALHNNSEPFHPDSMAIPGEAYLQWVMRSFGLSGFPSCVVNRDNNYAGDPLYLPDGFKAMSRMTDYTLGVGLNADYNPADETISATVSVFPTLPTDGSQLRLFFVVIENDVHRTHAETGIEGKRCGYDQLNAYAGGEECYGFELLPQLISADDMWYQEVARGTEPANDFNGLAGLLPRDMAAETVYTCTHAMQMPAMVLKTENTELIVMLIDQNGHVVNADKAPLHFAETDGISTLRLSSTADSYCYDLLGRRLQNPQKGLTISNGKKILR